MTITNITILEKAIAHHNAGDMAAALDLYRRALAMEPNFGIGWNLMAMATARSDGNLAPRSDGNLAPRSDGNLTALTQAMTAMIRALRCQPPGPLDSGVRTNLGNLAHMVASAAPRPRDEAPPGLTPLTERILALLFDVPIVQAPGVIPAILYPWALLAVTGLGRREWIIPIATTGIESLGDTPSAIPAMLMMGLLDLGVIREDLYPKVVRAAIRALPARPDDRYLIGIILQYVYHRDRPWLLSRLRRRLLAPVPEISYLETISTLSPWHLCDPHEDFFRAIKADPPVESALGRLSPAPPLAPTSGNGDDLIVLTCCDDGYLRRFAPRLIGSLIKVAEHAPNFTLHLHIIDPGPDVNELVRALAANAPFPVIWSGERTDDLPQVARDKLRVPLFRRSYYACARFLRLPAFLKHHQRPILTVDTDAVFTAPPAFMLAAMDAAAHDVCIPNGTRLGPSREFFCNIVHHQGTPAGWSYADLVARYIWAYFRDRMPLWPLDQTALYTVHTHMRDRGEAPRLHHFNVDETGVSRAFAHVMTMDEAEKHRVLDTIDTQASPTG